MKKKVLILWGAFVVCVIATVGLWFKMNSAELEYEEVSAVVISSTTKQVRNRKNGTTYNTYEVKVEYDGEEYKLENVHSAASYSKGRTVKAYLSDGRLFVNVEGVKTSTPIAIVYFCFLFGSFGLLMWAATYSGKVAQKKIQA